MNPSGDQNRSDAVSDHDNVLQGKSMMTNDLPNKRIYIFHQCPAVLGRTSLTSGASMTTRIPGKHRYVIKAEQFNEFRPASGMLVPTVKKQQRFLFPVRWNPSPVKKLGAIPTRHRLFNRGHGGERVLLRQRAVRQQLPHSHSCLARSKHNCGAYR